MKTISQYREDIKNLMKKVGDIDAQATNENRDMTEAEISLKNEILDTVEEIHKQVATMERQERLSRTLSQPEERQTVEGKKKDKNLMDRIEAGTDSRSKDKFASFGQQLAAIMRAGTPGNSVDPRLYNAASGLNETVPSDGGFMVQTDFASEILKQTWETAKIAKLCKRVPISGNANGTVLNGIDETSRAAGSRYGGIRGYWAAEAEEKTKSKPKFRQIELQLKKLIGLCYATDEVLADASQLEAIIRDGFVSEFGFLLDDAVIRGTGAGQPLGVLNSGVLVQAQGVGGQDTASVIGANIIEMWGRLFAQSRPNAVWLVNQEVEVALMEAYLSTGTNSGQLVYMPPGGLSGTGYGSLLGRPVIPCEQCEAIGTLGDIILGDFTNGYILAEKGGIQSDMSIHVRFQYDESVFRFVMRVDGQPVRSAPLTPYKGTGGATLSHFVGLRTARQTT